MFAPAKSMNLTFLVLIISTTLLQASRISDLIYRKYDSEINPQRRQVSHVNENGEQVTYSLPGITHIFALPLKDPAKRALLENFENDPEAVFNDRYIRGFLIFHVARDYESDQISRDIFNRCLALGLGLEYVHNVLVAAIRADSITLVDTIVSEYGSNFYDSCDNFSYAEPESFIETICKNGKFDLVRKLFLEGKLLISPGPLAISICILTPPKYTEEVISFLDFLIVQQELFDINTPIVSYYKGYPHHPILHSLLYRYNHIVQVKNMVETIAAYLISVGADPKVKCLDNRNAYEIAALNCYNLPQQSQNLNV